MGIIADADRDLIRARDAIEALCAEIPEHHRKEGFVFHATEIWNARRYREGWEFEERFAFLLKFFSLPRRLRLSISLGMVRVDAPQIELGAGVTQAQFRHYMAFKNCMAKADSFIRRVGHPQELGYIICEDIPEMRRLLSAATNIRKPYTITGDLQRPTEFEIANGLSPASQEVKIERLMPSIYFATKSADPLLQLADACAFAFRRYFSDLKGGDEMVRAVLGEDLVRADWDGPASAIVWQAT